LKPVESIAQRTNIPALRGRTTAAPLKLGVVRTGDIRGKKLSAVARPRPR